METLSLLIKPASGRCNLRCKYCFYCDVAENRDVGDKGLMTEKTLEKLVRCALETDARRVSFAFQGGEPMLAGLPFFEKFAGLEKACARPGVRIEHSIQTNGTLIDDKWAEYFRQNRFLVGVSMDGTKALHDRFRVDVSGKGSWNTVSRSLETLKRHGVPFNLLCVVTGVAAAHGQAVYGGLKRLGGGYLQFIPCLDPALQRGAREYSLTPERYAQFLKSVFDLWYRDWEAGNYVSVRLFDDYVHILAGMKPGSCATSGQCGQYLVVEGDGSVYPCDFFALDEWYMGNIAEMPISELLKSERAALFFEKGAHTPEGCAACRYLLLCRGGCKRDFDENGGNYYCRALLEFFEYAHERLEFMAQAERRVCR